MLKAMVIGNLGGNPETRYSAQGTPIVSFSVASTEGSGDTKKVEWVRCSVFGRQGELCAQYLAKGRKVFVLGRLSTHTFEGQDGAPRFSVELNADTVQFIDSRQADAAPSESTGDDDAIPF